MKIICECGKTFVAGDQHRIRCHICGRLIELAQIRIELEEKDRQAKIAEAADRKYVGLRFDGLYCTASPIELNALLAEFLDIQLRFRQDLNVEVNCRHWTTENEEVVSDQFHTEVITYHLSKDDTIVFRLEADCWMYDWEGQLVDTCVHLTYRMEEWFGIASDAIGVSEGEGVLVFRKDGNVGEEQ